MVDKLAKWKLVLAPNSTRSLGIMRGSRATGGESGDGNDEGRYLGIKVTFVDCANSKVDLVHPRQQRHKWHRVASVVLAATVAHGFPLCPRVQRASRLAAQDCTA